MLILAISFISFSYQYLNLCFQFYVVLKKSYKILKALKENEIIILRV